jgi:hypothetical protein
MMRSHEVPVGSLAFWFTWKVFSVFVLIVFPSVVLTGAEFKEPMRYRFLFILLGILIVGNEDLVYGYATEQGMHFRRYFKMQALSWEAISSIRWFSSNNLQIQLRRGSLFRKSLFAQSFRSSSISEWLTGPPEVVRWLLVNKAFRG